MIKRDLGVCSTMATPLDVPGSPPGVLLVSSARPDAFTPDQLRMLNFVARWLELLAARPSREGAD